jgi:mannonate dehydratase
MSIKVGMHVGRAKGPMAPFLVQHGVHDVIGGWSSNPRSDAVFAPERGLSADAHWTVEDATTVRDEFARAGLTLHGIENPLPQWCVDHIQLGLPGRDAQIENVARTIRAMGAAGLTLFGYHWMVNPPGRTRASWRTTHELEGRGGAIVEGFDREEAAALPLFRGREYGAEEMWANYAYFIRAILPVCEEAGVRLAVHPDDPPIPTLGGVARLFHSFESHRRALEIAGDSPYSGLDFCLGNWTAMGGDLLGAIRHFVPKGQILYGHLQGVHGAVPKFQECFVDESRVDFATVVRTLREVGFDGLLIPGHFPRTVATREHDLTGHAFAIGYLRGLIQAVG